jgi:hypothetical protein
MVDRPASLGRAAGESDLPAVARCLASAFHEDPLWGRWTFPDGTSRSERLYELMRFWSAAAVRHRWVRMTENAESVAVWLPAGEPEMTTDEERLFRELLVDLLGSRADEVSDLFALFDEHHPEEPHYYLSLWGTHRDHAGGGHGTVLIRDNLALIDTQRMPAYLESTNPANLPRYEALGFSPRAEFGPDGGPVITTMWRDAR